jgi:DNA-binding beta-propeller fold protein YncE
VRTCAVVIALVATAAMVFSAEKTRGSNLVWPSPPAEPRIRFVQSIAGPADVGIRPSAWSRLANLVTGSQKGLEKFDKPFGIAVDEQGNLCVTDTGTASVCFYDRRRKTWQWWERIGKQKFMSPVAVAKRGDQFFVADSALQKIFVFRGNGEPLFEMTKHIERPVGLAISGSRLFVADSQQHAIVVFDLAGNFLRTFGKRGAAGGEFNFPTHIWADEKGRIYVTDSLNSRIQIFDADGNFVRVFGTAGDGSGHFSRPKGVAVDRFGHLYIADALHDNVQIFDDNGRFLLEVGASGKGQGEFWLPAGLAVSRNDEVFIADSYNHRVQVLQYIGRP